MGKVSETPVAESVCYGGIPSSLSLKVIELIESPTPHLSPYIFCRKNNFEKILLLDGLPLDNFFCFSFHSLYPDYRINFEITDSPFPFLLWLNHSKSMSLPCNSSHIVDKWIQVQLCIMNGVFVSVKTSNHFEIMTERLSSASFIQESYQVCWRARLLWMKGKYLVIR